jgi:hypothetical protein
VWGKFVLFFLRSPRRVFEGILGEYVFFDGLDVVNCVVNVVRKTPYFLTTSTSFAI